jgi:II/X family phage/plasmid replication protein
MLGKNQPVERRFFIVKTHTFSTDTIRFLIPFSCKDLLEKVCDCFQKASEYRRFSLEGECEKEYSKFRLMTTPETLGRRSYDDSISFSPQADEHACGLLFEFSVPKLKYGHSSFLVWDLPGILEEFRDTITQLCYGYDFPPVNCWILKRIDLAYNFILPGIRQVDEILNHLVGMKLRGKPSRFRHYPYWNFSNRTVKFYSKFLEMKKHKETYYVPNGRYEEVLANSSGILRFEEEWRSAHLLRKLEKVFPGIKSRQEITIGKFLHYMQGYSWKNHIEGYVKTMEKRRPVTEIHRVLYEIRKNLRNSNTYIEFVTLILAQGVEKTKSQMKNGTFYAKKRKLLSIGIDINILEENQNARMALKESEFDYSNIVNAVEEEAEFYNELMEKYEWSEQQLQDRIFLGSAEWKHYRTKFDSGEMNEYIEAVREEKSKKLQ